MGDDGTMAKGTRCTPEFRAKAVRLLAESRSSYSSETNAISAVAKDPGIAPESLRRWRDQSDATVAEETRQSAEDAMAELRRLRAENAELRRANEILTTASAFFFRGRARPDTALMAAYIDEHESRFKVGPICGVLSESLDCGFLTPRGCRMLETRPVSRMRAGHEAPARDSSRSARISSWPCTVTGRCTRSWSPRAGIRPRSAATG